MGRDGTRAHPDADLSMWIRDYGRDGATLIPLPEEAWDFAEAFELDDEPLSLSAADRIAA